MTWLFGITWLPLVFGAWFAWKLLASGMRPSGGRLAVLRHGILGALLALAGLRFVVPLAGLPFPPLLLLIWGFMVAGAAVAWLSWPALGRVLFAYGLLARIPVAAVMLFAMLGQWGTHYDYVGVAPARAMPLLPRYFWLGFFPQLVFWVAFTVVLGFVGAGVVVLARGRVNTV
jgi:hypothetical protein